MRLVFSDQAWEDYLFWQQEGSGKVDKIHALIKETRRDPFRGLGKPEPLKGALAGYGSRRITDEHRMVYKVATGDLLIAQLRYHY
jgi:toxin YoeB